MTETLAGVLTEIDAVKATAAQRQAENDKYRASAQQARDKAEQLERQAAENARLARNDALRKLNALMREWSAQVTQARQAAITAIEHGDKVVDAWVCYRLTAATVHGRWTVLADEYQSIVGRELPPGPFRPELRAEPFETFLRNAMPAAERKAHEQGNRQAQDERNAHQASKAATARKAQAAKPQDNTTPVRGVKVPDPGSASGAQPSV